MDTTTPELEFLLITEENINLAIKVAKKIFPYEISKNGMFIPEKEYRLSIGKLKNICNFFIVKYSKEIVGITGYNNHLYNPKNDEVWIAYFGIIEKYRGNGLGKKIILKTLELIKANHLIKTIKLLTSNREEEQSSHNLYRCVGFKKYAHRKTYPYQIYYFYMKNIKVS